MELDVGGPERPHKSLLRPAAAAPAAAPGKRDAPSHPEAPNIPPRHLSRKTWNDVRDAVTANRQSDAIPEQLTLPGIVSSPAPPDLTVHSLPIEQPAGISAPKNPAQYKSWRFKGYLYLDQEPLFNGPPSPSQVKQGPIGDCFVIAPLAMAAQLEPDELTSRVTQVNDTTYDVRLGGPVTGEVVHRLRLSAPKSEAVHKDGADPFLVGTHVRTNTGALWPVLFEKAYAAEMEHGYQDLLNGGSPARPIERFFDMKSKTASISPCPTGGNNSLDTFSNSRYENFLKQNLEKHQPTVLAVHVPMRPEYSPPDVGGLSPEEADAAVSSARTAYQESLDHARKVQEIAEQYGLVANEDTRHAYWLYDYDPSKHAFKIANPHGFELMSDWIPVDKLRELNYRVYWGEKERNGTS